VAKYLSPEWRAHTPAGPAGCPPPPGARARLQYVVKGGPDGDVRYHHVVENGHTLEFALGDDPDAEVTLTAAYDDKLKVDKGELDPMAAFMQGRVKVEGEMAKLMALLPLTNTPEYRAIQDEVRDQTEF
jgi:alkyl sulfatase BDS1-like metallo-beta-lactamase superfamily hydrolase